MSEPTKTPEPAGEYERFKELTARLLAVTKEEIDRKAAEEDVKQGADRRKGKAAK